MAETITIARPYAEAVFDLARQENTLAEWSEMLQFTSAVVANPGVAALIGDPRIPAEKMLAFFLSVGEGRLNERGASLVKLLVQNGRLALVPEISALFEQLRSEQEGKLEAEIISAFPLDEKQRADLAGRLEARFGKKVDARARVDASLIGGVRIVIGDHVIDQSVRARLADMAQTLRY
jgi:F-type H+-transporting ATPase subunit delta